MRALLSDRMLDLLEIYTRSIAQSGSASGLGPEGRGFESLCSDQFSSRFSLAPVAQLDRAPAF